MAKLQISELKRPAVTIRRSAVVQNHVVYIVVASKPLPYEHASRSTIVYVGSSESGPHRVSPGTSKSPTYGRIKIPHLILM